MNGTLVNVCFDSEDYKEGRDAFMEKRNPVFKGGRSGRAKLRSDRPATITGGDVVARRWQVQAAAGNG